jgi:hypothetical protein
MTRILLFLAVAMTILQCEGDSKGMKAYYHKGGKAVECRLSPADRTKTLAMLNEVFAGTDDMLRVHVSEQLVGRIRTTETALEFVFDKPSEFASRKHGKYAVKRLLLPLTGDYAGTGNDSVATVFVANDAGFISGPLRNPQARPVLLKLQNLLSKLPQSR